MLPGRGQRDDAQRDGGRIVNVATRPALEWRAGAGMVAYAASKAAVAALTVALAEEVVQAGILVNAVAPSTMDTPANRQAMPKADHAAWPKVEEVAATILFLASPENRVTRGAVVPVYGKGVSQVPRPSRRTGRSSIPTGTMSRAGARTSRVTALAATTVRCCA